MDPVHGAFKEVFAKDDGDGRGRSDLPVTLGDCCCGLPELTHESECEGEYVRSGSFFWNESDALL